MEEQALASSSRGSLRCWVDNRLEVRGFTRRPVAQARINGDSDQVASHGGMRRDQYLTSSISAHLLLI